MTVAQKFRPFQSTVFAVSQPAVPQDTTHFTPKVGYEVMTHSYFKWNIVCSPLQHGFLFGGSNAGKDAFSFCSK